MQCTAGADAVHCRKGCSALQEGLQCTASERGKTGTEIASPILDKRKGREKGLYMEHCSPQIISAEPKIFKTRIPWSYDHSTLWSYVHTSLVGRS